VRQDEALPPDVEKASGSTTSRGLAARAAAADRPLHHLLRRRAPAPGDRPQDAGRGPSTAKSCASSDAPSEILEGLDIDESGKAIFEKNEDCSTSIYRETGTGWREHRSGGDDSDAGTTTRTNSDRCVGRRCVAARAATRTSATPPRCGDSRSTLELADQEGVRFGHYDLNDFRFLGVRKRKLAEERRKAAVPGR
jgi:hypothetical protein